MKTVTVHTWLRHPKAGLPVIFNSRNPIVKLFTTFQVEALNNLQHTFKDLPREARESKCFLWLVKCILAQWLAKYLFNKGKEKLTGSGSSEFEPITLGVTAYKAIAQKDGVTAEDVQEVLGNTAANLPGMQTVMALAGFDNAEQIPMSNMVPNIPELAGKIKKGGASYIEDMGGDTVNEQFYDEHYNTHGKSSYEILKDMANERRGKLPKAQNSETYQNNMNNTEQQSEAMNKLRQMIESDDAKRAGKTSLNYGNYKVTK